LASLFYSAQVENVVPKGSNREILDLYAAELEAEELYTSGDYVKAAAKLQILLDRAKTMPVDDVTLRVAMGALCVLTGTADTLKVGCKSNDALAGGAALIDGVRKSQANFGITFPYLNAPIPDNFNP
jgi:hypothetical protein